MICAGNSTSSNLGHFVAARLVALRAQNTPTGIPPEFLENRRLEMERKREEVRNGLLDVQVWAVHCALYFHYGEGQLFHPFCIYLYLQY